jgi:hypothetical protein
MFDKLRYVKNFIWTSDMEDRYDLVRTLLLESPIMRAPNFKEHFELYTDASGHAVGGCLKQGNYFIGMVSRSLRKNELNY